MQLKKKCLIILTFAILLTSCSVKVSVRDDESGARVSDTVGEVSESEITTASDTESIANDTEPTTPAADEKTADLSIGISEARKVPAEKITASQMEYSSYTVRGTLVCENDIYQPYLFVGDSLYYTDSEVESDVIKFFRHRLVEDKSELLFEIGWDMADSAYEIVNGCFFTAPCVMTDDGELEMSLYCYDLNENTHSPEKLVTFTAKTPLVDICRLNEKEVLFFAYKSFEGSSVDLIYRYNTETKELSTFYEDYTDDWDDLRLTSQNVAGMSARNNTVYLLKYQSIDNELIYSLETYDSDGNILSDCDLKFLNTIKHSCPDIESMSVRDFSCINDYLMVYDVWYSLSLGDNAPWQWRLCKRSGHSFKDIDISEYKPTFIQHQAASDDRFIIMGSGRDDIDLLIFDTVEGVLTPIELDVPDSLRFESYNIVSNEEGEVVLIGEEEDGQNKVMYKVGIKDLGAD